MENVKLWQYVVIAGIGALAGILSAVVGLLPAKTKEDSKWHI